jgi:hypothetical protein
MDARVGRQAKPWSCAKLSQQTLGRTHLQKEDGAAEGGNNNDRGFNGSLKSNTKESLGGR